MRIHTDPNGLYVNAMFTSNEKDVEGHQYVIVAGVKSTLLDFQQGAIKEAGLNGITNESLLDVIIHRMNYLNKRFPCIENENAIKCLNDALSHLNARTSQRISRGVEGKELA